MNPPLPPLRETIAKYGLNASKALGQNFLLDSQLLDKIAALGRDISGKQVFEVGPGPGGLTRALLKAGAKVTAVERDRRCIPALEELGAHYPERLTLIEADALEIGLEEVLPQGGEIIANLPYNIATALLVHWLKAPQWPPRWQGITCMFQMEVAERICAPAGGSAYGRLAILAQWRAEAKLVMKVHRSAFTPPPRIISAIVRIVPKPAPEGVDVAVLERLTAAGFGQRRKMLRQSLKPIPHALAGLQSLGLEETLRAESLRVEDWVQLARLLTQHTRPQV
jgi:16S rRNA (adenine1518-N6/adenine1519-N6)-dimethyltransferase